ncbi:MAG TPA: hypothetical protein VJV05_11310 [Pyrinomonadaceae bacterium]|nr:hypothetical protein [Pyrinomonadaceae bacterium]
MFKSLVIVCLFILGAAAQESNAPILVDEFENTGCCDIRARIDNFLQDVAIHPTDLGLIAIVGPKDKIVEKVFREELVRSHVLLRKFDPARLRFVRAEGDTLKYAFWRLPAGSAMPELFGTDNTYIIDVAKPMMLYADYPYGDGGLCPAVERRELFTFFLAANPTSRAKVVIRGHSRRETARIQRELSRFLVNENEFDSLRIEFVHTSREDGRGFGPSTEYWFLP